MSPLVRRGFMLLEAAVALVVIGLVAAAALQLYALQLRATAREPQLLVATALAQDRLTAIRLLEPDRLMKVPDSLAQGRFAAPFVDYRWQASVRHTAQPDLYDVRVEISWNAGTLALSSRLQSASATTGGLR